MGKDKELLRLQLQLLAERSKGAMEEDLSNLSNSMCEVYKLLSQTEFAVIAQFAVLAYLSSLRDKEVVDSRKQLQEA